MLVTNFHEISLIGRKIDRTLMTPVASVQRHKGGGGVYGDLGRNPRRPAMICHREWREGKKFQLSESSILFEEFFIFAL